MNKPYPARHQKAIKEAQEEYGTPRVLKMSFSMSGKEFADLKNSMWDGRNSDITFFIFKEDKVIVIAKPWYKKGLYRAPSGGWKPNESLEECALREAYEETGTKIKLKKYILRIEVTFTYKNQRIDWTSHIFTASYLSGDLKPVDTREIKEVTLFTLEELNSLKPLLLKTGSGGLAYRAALTEAVFTQLRRNIEFM